MECTVLCAHFLSSIENCLSERKGARGSLGKGLEVLRPLPMFVWLLEAEWTLSWALA
jgi:hypothetical protein